MSAVDRLGLPSSPDIERLVLGGLLVDPESVPAAVAILERGDFAVEDHARVWECISSLHEQGEQPERITVFAEMQRRGWPTSLESLMALDEGLPQIVRIDHYIDEIRLLARCRRAMTAMGGAIERIATERTPDALARAETVLRELNGDGERPQLLTLEQYLGQLPGGVQGFLAPSAANGIPTPWPSVDRFYTGFSPGKLVVLAARTSMGKSAVAGQIALHAARLGKRVALFSLEMESGELWRRMVRQSDGDDRDRHSLQVAASTVARLPIWICDRANCAVSAVRGALAKHGGTNLVIVDYLQLLRPVGRFSNRVEQVSAITRDLKLAARESGAAWLVLAQLNREAEKDDQPKLSHLRESGSIEQDADDVLLLHMAEKARQELRGSRGTPQPIQIILAKQRNGQTGAVTLEWNPARLRIEERGCDQ